MKLTLLYEYLQALDGPKYNMAPKSARKKDMSFLVGGKEDRERFLKWISGKSHGRPKKNK